MAGIAISTFLNKVLTVSPMTTNMWQVSFNSGIDLVDKFFQDFTLYARDFKLPRIGIDYKLIWFRGVPIPVPCNPDLQQDMTVTMYADVEGGVQQSLRYWMNHIIDLDFENGSYLGGTRSINKASTMRLELLDKDMETVTETCTLVGVTIKSVGEITFTQNAGDIAMFPMEFKFVWPKYELPE